MAEVNKANAEKILLRLQNTVEDLSVKAMRARYGPERDRYSSKADGIEYAIGVLTDYFEIEGLTYRRNAIEATI